MAVTQAFRGFWKSTLCVCIACLPALAQQNVQFLPEVDAYLKLNSVLRLYLEAKDDQDGGDPAQAGIGPSVQLYLKPLDTIWMMPSQDFCCWKLVIGMFGNRTLPPKIE